MELVRPASSESIERLLASLTDAQPTYSEIGATLRGDHPDGYHHGLYQTTLGMGPEVFQRATVGLQTWKAHRGPGTGVLPHGTTIKTGATVVVTLGTPWLALAAPCRIVGVVDESDRWGFAYGTLPDHPEQGEESFVVSVTDEGVVEFKITAFSRPGQWITRLTGPVGRAAQAAGTNGYLKALRRFVNQSE
jgi:uncharacterized protein (UPF0548 family)